MFNSVKFHEIIKERNRLFKETQDEWDYGIDKCREQMVEILTLNMSDTINFLKTDCTADEFVWISEVYEEILVKTKSKEFIQCIKDVAQKFPTEVKDYYILETLADAESQM